ELVLFPKQRQPTPDAIVSHFKGKLRVNQKEPIRFDGIFLTSTPPHPDDETHRHYWFRDDEADTCFIPDRMAAEMKITPLMVETGNVRIRVEGTVLAVKGIYDSNRFDQLHDLDGESLAPYDVESIVGRPNEEESGEDEMPEMMKRLSGSDIIICNDWSRTAGWHVASIAIDLSKAGSHKRVRQILDRYLEKTGSKAFYGIGDMAYFGAKFRRPRGSNYLELLIPLLIASLTVLNTMRGSVYERKDEIYVYNAVGLNPFHVFFLFIAEACVYAVVGALGGYLVANLAGKLVTLAGWNVGLTINYSSIYAVMYSLVIMVAVLFSTWFPARAAARLAAPAEEMKWRVPSSVDGSIRFHLPFTFSIRDRVAIVAYFMGWFDEFGEGSSGRFFCSPPSCTMTRFQGEVASCVHTTAWLRPYDLGVSQEVILHFSEDPRSGQTVAHLTLNHLSGGLSSWMRTNYLFLKILRKHFLDWRVVPEAEKLSFLHRARRLLGADERLVEEARQAIDAEAAAATPEPGDRTEESPGAEAAHGR
ncbi:MAG: ABC transporter permease, partial [Lentisphaeria bacterium]|nr:ABC transporter permease [Lentisphaeria bacterium]